MHFGQLLNLFRTEREYSMRELARLIERDAGYISRLESGEKEEPSAEVLQELKKALKLNDRKREIFDAVSGIEMPDALVTLFIKDPSIIINDARAAATMSNRGSRPLTEEDWRVVVSKIAKIRVELKIDD